MRDVSYEFVFCACADRWRASLFLAFGVDLQLCRMSVPIQSTPFDINIRFKGFAHDATVKLLTGEAVEMNGRIGMNEKQWEICVVLEQMDC